MRPPAQEAGTEHDVGHASFQRLEQHVVLPRVVLQVGILDDDVLTAGYGEGAAQRRPLAAVDLMGDDREPLVVDGGDEVGEHLGRAIRRSVVDDHDLGGPR